ncbi:MAG: TolC family protein, partial [Acidobacteriales bacterium]|nr:TolC family protein [Terriglobales bacterium]
MNSRLLSLAVVLSLVASAAECQPLTFQEAITKALLSAKAIRISHAEDLRVHRAYFEARDAYIPQVQLGSGAAYTFGFPIGEPSVFKITSQSLLWNPAQKEYIKAAGYEIQASDASLDEKRQEVILETAITYADLDRHLQALSLLKREEDAANRALDIVAQRISAGIEPPVEQTRAKLIAARVRIKRSQVEGDTDLLRLRLAQLTGVPAAGLETVAGTMPKVPAPIDHEDLLKMADATPSVQALKKDSIAKDHTASAEWKQLRPAVNLVGQYALFSNAINNYSAYYKSFQKNNGAFGVEIKVPFLNLSQRAKAAGAEADAVKATALADETQDQVASEIVRLQKACDQLSQAQEIAE